MPALGEQAARLQLLLMNSLKCSAQHVSFAHLLPPYSYLALFRALPSALSSSSAYLTHLRMLVRMQ